MYKRIHRSSEKINGKGDSDLSFAKDRSVDARFSPAMDRLKGDALMATYNRLTQEKKKVQ